MVAADFKWKKGKKHVVFVKVRKNAGSGMMRRTAEKREKRRKLAPKMRKSEIFLLNFQPFSIDFFEYVQYVIASMIRYSGLPPRNPVRDPAENHNPSRFMEESS